MRPWIRRLALEIISQTGYRSPTISILNSSPAHFQINRASNTLIQRGAKISGQVTLMRGATVEKGAKLYGNIVVGEDAEIKKGARIYADDINIGNNVRVGENTYVQKGIVKIGESTKLVRENEIYGDVNIGMYNAIAPHVIFQAENHPTSNPSLQTSFYDNYFDCPLEHEKERITIKNDTWVGARSILLSGVEIGNGAIIGAGSVVTRDVEPYSIVAGVPAEHKKWRFDKSKRDQLKEIKWWEWDQSRIQANKDFFKTDLNTVDNLHDLIN